MNKLIVVILYIFSFIMLNLSMDQINFNAGINPWIGLPLSFISLAIAYLIMHKAMSHPSYEWKCKPYHY